MHAIKKITNLGYKACYLYNITRKKSNSRQQILILHAEKEFDDLSKKKPLCGFPYAVHMQFVIKLHTNLLAVICIIKTGFIINKVLLTP